MRISPRQTGRRAPGGAEGFTLIELAILLAVVAIGAAVIVPDFIQSTRDTLAEKAAQDILRLQDAAKWYYVASSMSNPGTSRRWPGQLFRGDCTPRQALTRANLIGDGYVTAGAYDDNPWGHPYEAFVRNDCSFQVRARVPARVAGVLERMLPAGNCEPSCRAPMGGDRFCCSTIPRPGDEPYLDGQTAALELTEDVCFEMGGELIGGECELFNTSVNAGNCAWYGEGVCPGNKVLINTKCVGKYCNPIGIYCCDMKLELR